MPSKKDGAKDKGPVGYGRPPVEHQFRKGKSGNPKGRPRGTRNFATDVKWMLQLPVPVEQDGVRKIVSTQLAILLRLREKALKGEGRALDGALDLALQHNSEEPPPPPADQGPEDQAIFDAFVARIRGEIVGADAGRPKPENQIDEADGHEQE